MHRTLMLLAILAAALAGPARARGDEGKNFLGFGPGMEFFMNNGSGTGFYIQGFGGHSFTQSISLGLHAGFSNVGNVDVETVDYGTFFQYLDPDSGLYGRFYLDGMWASVSGGNHEHGVAGTQSGFAPGVGLGMELPATGTFHIVPEATYRSAFFQSQVNIIDITFNLMWDF